MKVTSESHPPAAALIIIAFATFLALVVFTAPLTTLEAMTRELNLSSAGQAWVMGGMPLGCGLRPADRRRPRRYTRPANDVHRRIVAHGSVVGCRSACHQRPVFDPHAHRTGPWKCRYHGLWPRVARTDLPGRSSPARSGNLGGGTWRRCGRRSDHRIAPARGFGLGRDTLADSGDLGPARPRGPGTPSGKPTQRSEGRSGRKRRPDVRARVPSFGIDRGAGRVRDDGRNPFGFRSSTHRDFRGDRKNGSEIRS